MVPAGGLEPPAGFPLIDFEFFLNPAGFPLMDFECIKNWLQPTRQEDSTKSGVVGLLQNSIDLLGNL